MWTLPCRAMDKVVAVDVAVAGIPCLDESCQIERMSRVVDRAVRLVSGARQPGYGYGDVNGYGNVNGYGYGEFRKLHDFTGALT